MGKITKKSKRSINSSDVSTPPCKKIKLDVAICTIIKDEHIYLDEWIQYHKSIGVNKIYIYEDYGSKSHKDICNKYKGVILDSLENFGVKNVVGRQFDGFQKHLEKYRCKHDWCAFIDIDEFIAFKDGYDLDFLENFKNNTGVYLSWLMHNANGQYKYEDKPVRERFKKTTDKFPNVDKPRWRHKSIVNMRNVNAQLRDVHSVYNGVNTLGMRSDIMCPYEMAYLDHYFTKSWEEWTWRFSKRGDIAMNHRGIDEFFELNPDMRENREQMKSDLIKKLGK